MHPAEEILFGAVHRPVGAGDGEQGDQHFLQRAAAVCEGLAELIGVFLEVVGAVAGLVEQAADPHQRDGVTVIIEAHGPDDTPLAARPPTVRPTPELLHGLGSFVQNGVQFATATVEVTVSWDDTGALSVEVEDDGPGFAPSVLSRLGEPYVSTRTGRDGHMGLGVFIARTLLERTGAEVGFANRSDGGARVDVRWSNGIRLETPR